MRWFYTKHVIALGYYNNRQSLLRDVGRGRFPAPVKLTPRLNGWSEEMLREVDARRLAERDAKATG